MTTEAGKRLLAEANFTGGEVYFGEPGRWEAAIAAIESEARAAERARLRERVEEAWPVSVFASTRELTARAAVLAILEK